LGLYITKFSIFRFLHDGAVVGAAVVVVVTVTEHISSNDEGKHTGVGQHALITHTECDDGHPEPLDVQTSNNEHAGAGEQTVEPEDVLNA
jgi:hypothetical protein